MSKPKVLLLGPLPPPYIGPAIATEILLKSSLGEKFRLYHLNTNVHREISTLGSRNVGKILKNLLIYLNLVSIIFKNWPDIVLIPISQMSLGFYKDSVYIVISRLFRRKTLLQLRGSNFQNWLNSSPLPVSRYVSFVLRSSQGMVVLGKSLKYLFRAYFDESRLFVVPNGADLSIESVPRNAGSPVRILFLSNIGLSKGIEDVINAIGHLEQHSQVPLHLDIVGDWRDSLTQERVTFLLRDKKLPLTIHGQASGAARFKHFATADMFVFPPREPEGHPWVIVEAMAAGLPIIATDQGAITESVLDGVNGFIVETGNPGQIAEKIKFLIENPIMRKKMGQESRRLYLENFTEEKMVERLSAAFRAVLAK